MEEIEIALLVAISVLVVLLTTIWWAIRARKRQESSSKPIKVPSPQEDLREARNRYYNESKQTEPREENAGRAKREFSFTKLQRTWASKEQQDRNRRPRNRDTILETDENASTSSLSAEMKSPMTEPMTTEKSPQLNREIVKAETKKMDDVDERRTSMLITPVKQKVIHYKYSSLPNTKLPAEGYDDCGHPIIQPIKSIYKLFSWLPGFDGFNIATVPLRRRSNNNPSCRIIVCHDMMGGYTKDKYPQGTNTTSDYYFYHWHLIESFVYFSHNFITIPPASWTNAAHTNGVLSLGTIITEWEDGARTCNHLLSTKANIDQFVEQCVSLANYYQFDGWLINIENNLQQDQVNVMLDLVKSLTDAMHAAKPWSQVIWYDSVIVTGQLKWQNSLNQYNQIFFDACDGIFLNYIWNDWMLASSKSLAGENRATQVYVGIDVFGRGCFGGGGYNSAAALKMARKHGLSAAIFAPGWVFENQNKDEFIKNQNKFWSLLEPHCESRIVDGLPLVTSFCRGFGHLVAVDGKVVHRGSWSNQSAQNCQMTFDKDMFELGVKGSLFIDSVDISTKMAYNNGSSLNVAGKVFKCGVSSRTVIRLFLVEANFNKPLLVAYTYSLAKPGSLLHSLQLHTNKAPRYVILDPQAPPHEDTEPDSIDQVLLSKYEIIRSGDHQVPGVSGIDQSNYVCFAPLPLSHSKMIHKKFTGQEELTSGEWETCYFFVTTKQLSTATVREVRLVCEPPAKAMEDNTFDLSIGEIKVLNARCIGLDYVHASVSHLSCSEVSCSQTNTTLSATLHWQLHQNNPVDPTLHYNVYHQFDQKDSFKFTGRAFTTYYRVNELKLPATFVKKQHSEVVFYIQSVTQSGRKSAVGDCPTLAMNWD